MDKYAVMMMMTTTTMTTTMMMIIEMGDLWRKTEVDGVDKSHINSVS